MPDDKTRSLLFTVGWVGLIFVGIVVFGIVTGLTAFVPLGFIWIAVALILRQQALGRRAGAERRAPGLVGTYPMTVAAERVNVGASMQLRRSGDRAAGLLCVGPGRAGFVPSKERHADRGWEGPVDHVEVHNVLGSAVVRVFDAAGTQSAQFVVQTRPTELVPTLAAYVHVVDP